MRKITLLFATVLLLALPAKAQLSWANLYGEYKFTATLEITNAGEKYADQFSGDCDVTIENGVFGGKIVGFGGSSNSMTLSNIYESSNQIKVTNPNNPQLWSGIYMTKINGENPYTVWEGSTQLTEGYGPIYFTWDPDTKDISIPDFAVVEIEGYNSLNTTILATFTNVKMTFVSAAVIDVPDVSGDYVFKAGSGQYDVMTGSTVPTTFPVSLVKTSDDNKNYNAEFSIEGYNDFTLPTTFDGTTLKMAFDNTVVYQSETDTIRLNAWFDITPTYTIDFLYKLYKDEVSFSLNGGFAFVSDTVKWSTNPDTNEEELVADIAMKQYYVVGSLKKATDAGGSADFDWEGDYTFTSEVYAYDTENEYPATFDVTIAYFDGTAYDMDSYYYISSFLGKDINGTPIKLNIAEDGKSAEMVAGDKCRYIGANDSGAYFYNVLYDLNATKSPIAMTLNEDGTIAVADFYLKLLTRTYPNLASNDWNTFEDVETPAASYMSVTLAKKTSTGIEDVNTENSVVKGIYDLFGRRIETITVPGIYIVDGVKKLVK